MKNPYVKKIQAFPRVNQISTTKLLLSDGNTFTFTAKCTRAKCSLA